MEKNKSLKNEVFVAYGSVSVLFVMLKIEVYSKILQKLALLFLKR